jgi:hypothetical protein
MRAPAIEVTIYWALAGALIGFGVIGGFSIGIPLVLIGIYFMSFGLARLEHRGLWAALVGFGAVPMGLLLWNSGSDAIVGVLLFGAIVAAGMIWGLLEALQPRKVPN